MRHANVNEAAYKVSDDKTVQQEHTYAVAEKRRRDRELMRGGKFQYHGGRQGGVYRGRGDVYVFGADYGTFRRRLAGGLLEYQEGAASLGPSRQVTAEGGGGDFCFSKVLSDSSVGGVTILRGNLGVVSRNDQNNGGGPRGFSPAVDGLYDEPTVGQDLEQSGRGNFLKEAGT